MVESFSSFRLNVYFMWNVQLKLKIIKTSNVILNRRERLLFSIQNNPFQRAVRQSSKINSEKLKESYSFTPHNTLSMEHLSQLYFNLSFLLVDLYNWLWYWHAGIIRVRVTCKNLNVSLKENNQNHSVYHWLITCNIR